MNTVETPFPLINAVVQGLQEGELFYGNDRRLFFALHKAGFSYLFPEVRSNLDSVIEFMLRTEQIPEYFHVYDAKPALIETCKRFPTAINTRIRKRIQLRHRNSGVIQYRQLESSYSIGKIDGNNFHLVDRFNLSIESRFWKSKQDFLDNGFGFTVNDAAGEPVSVCYAASVVGNIAEIDVATLEKERGKGLASAVVAAFVAYCHENRITANWDCFEDNKASLKTALSLGFATILEYTFLSIFNKERKNENS